MWQGRKVMWRGREVIILARIGRRHVIVAPVKRPEMRLTAKREEIAPIRR